MAAGLLDGLSSRTAYRLDPLGRRGDAGGSLTALVRVAHLANRWCSCCIGILWLGGGGVAFARMRDCPESGYRRRTRSMQLTTGAIGVMTLG